MAIINCPNCGKKTSEISSKCPHCSFDRDGQVIDESDDRKTELRRRALRDRVYHLKMISYSVITVFLAAFGWYWWDTSSFLEESSAGPLILLGLCTAGYLAIRVLLFRAKKALRAL